MQVQVRYDRVTKTDLPLKKAHKTKIYPSVFFSTLMPFCRQKIQKSTWVQKRRKTRKIHLKRETRKFKFSQSKKENRALLTKDPVKYSFWIKTATRTRHFLLKEPLHASTYLQILTKRTTHVFLQKVPPKSRILPEKVAKKKLSHPKRLKKQRKLTGLSLSKNLITTTKTKDHWHILKKNKERQACKQVLTTNGKLS